MKQKCILSKKKSTLLLKEVAQTEPGGFSLIYEAEFETSDVEEAIEKGQAAVIELFRSPDFYPTTFFSERIADGIISMHTTEPLDSLHIEFDDIENLQTRSRSLDHLDSTDEEQELAEIDKLLDDDDDMDIDIETDIAVSKSDILGAASDTPAEEI